MKAIKEFIRLNKKMFFTFCGIVGSFILILIILLIVKLVKGTKITYAQLETKMVSAAEEYYTDNTKTLPKVEGEEISISLDKLITDGYIKPLEKLVDATCTGTVTIKKNGKQYMYYPNLDCGSEYKTRFLSKIITDESNVVTEGAGVYKYDDGYVFRGEYVNNYVSFDDQIWRIISVDNAGNIKLIKNDKEKKNSVWDDRFNAEVKRNYGINNYNLSRIKERLSDIYNNDISEESKKHIVFQTVCSERRNSDDLVIKGISNCNSPITNQYLGIISIDDYYRASIDSKCENLSNDSCVNYNYLANIIENAWTATVYSDDSYEAYYIDETIDIEKNRVSKGIYVTLNLSGLETYESGTGEESNPYLVVTKKTK